MQLETPLDQVLQTGTHVRVLRALVALPPGLAASARDIARRAGVAHTTASRALQSLAAQGIVHVQHVARADLRAQRRRPPAERPERVGRRRHALVRTRTATCRHDDDACRDEDGAEREDALHASDYGLPPRAPADWRAVACCIARVARSCIRSQNARSWSFMSFSCSSCRSSMTVITRL